MSLLSHLVSSELRTCEPAGVRLHGRPRCSAATPAVEPATPALRAGLALLGAVALLAAVAVVAGAALALLAPPAGAAALTSGFVVPVPNTTTGSQAARAPLANVLNAPAVTGSALGERSSRSLKATVAPGGGTATRVDTGSRFDMIGVLFRTTAAGVRTVEFHLRVSLDGKVWTPWFAVKADAQSGPAGSVWGAADLVTEPVWVGAGRFVDYEVERTGAVAAPVSDVRLACIDSEVTTAVSPPSPASAAAASPTTASPAAAAEFGTTTTPGRLAAPTMPLIVTRATWGANEAYRTGSPSYGVVRCAFVHHTVNANTYTRAQAPALVRGIYYYHTQVNGWSRHRLQLSDRPLRHHLRRPLRRRHQGGAGRPGPGLQQHEHGRGADRHLRDGARRPRRRFHRWSGCCPGSSTCRT